MKIKNTFKSLTKFELSLWLLSLIFITLTFVIFKSSDILTIIASIIGATALIFVAKGNVIGQILTILFSVIYAVISYRFRYFGEMITYLGMTAPMALLSAVSWMKNPFKSGHQEVKVAKLTFKKVLLLLCLAGIVTTAFYFILKYFNTSNLIISTISITTSFLAAALTFMRSPYYAIAYSLNDIVLIILWVLASKEDISFLPMIICFVVFLINDIYGFINWSRMQKRQSQS
ncbi:MAG: nicotinamide riboside transporter PnuC [Clostridium sp.]|nr:nicotinamide riboside transporter PnuC [Clostridium sp.]